MHTKEQIVILELQVISEQLQELSLKINSHGISENLLTVFQVLTEQLQETTEKAAIANSINKYPTLEAYENANK